jgi:putative endonuclease
VTASDASIWWVYILKCCDGSFYVGSTTDLAARIRVHQSGKGPKHTAARLPVSLVFSEQHPTLVSAVKRERQIKRWTRAKKEALIAGNLARLHDLSQCLQSAKR